MDPTEYATRKTLEIRKLLGHGIIILRTDGELDIDKLSEHVAEHRSADTRTANETAPTADTKRNAFTENANTLLEAQTTTMLSALSHKIGCRVGSDWDIFPWVIVHSGTLINRFHIQPRRDGKTAYELATSRT